MRKDKPERVKDMAFAAHQLGTSYIAIEIYGAYYTVTANVHLDEVEIRTDEPEIIALTFEDFRESIFYDPYMKIVEGCEFDSSWVDSMQTRNNGRVGVLEFTSPIFDKPRHDPGGAHPTGETVDCFISADIYGGVYLKCGEKYADGDIADFIDRLSGTCRNASKDPEKSFVCSECGVYVDTRSTMMSLCEDDGACSAKDCEVSFCPNCGRKKV